MYRGRSFLLQRDYKVHISIVDELLKGKYNDLLNIKCKELQDEKRINLLMELYGNIKSKYRKIREGVRDVETDVSDMLITKVLLGTLGCVPAYDEYFVNGIRTLNNNNSQKVLIGYCGENSFIKLANFYVENETELEKVRREFKIDTIIYPQMKLIDMGLWQMGFNEKKK